MTAPAGTIDFQSLISDRCIDIDVSGIRRVFELYRAAFAGLPRDVWLLALTGFVNRAGTMVLPFLSLYLTQERGLGVVGAGRLLALYGTGHGP